jgi:hypothetical protein
VVSVKGHLRLGREFDCSAAESYTECAMIIGIGIGIGRSRGEIIVASASIDS